MSEKIIRSTIRGTAGFFQGNTYLIRGKDSETFDKWHYKAFIGTLGRRRRRFRRSITASTVFGEWIIKVKIHIMLKAHHMASSALTLFPPTNPISMSCDEAASSIAVGLLLASAGLFLRILLVRRRLLVRYQIFSFLWSCLVEWRHINVIWNIANARQAIEMVTGEFSY
jgi:hypothetical protein